MKIRQNPNNDNANCLMSMIICDTLLIKILRAFFIFPYTGSLWTIIIPQGYIFFSILHFHACVASDSNLVTLVL
jgi:hypothetical protein